MRGYVVDVYFCVFDVSVEEFGVGFGFRFRIGFRMDLELDLELDLDWNWNCFGRCRLFGYCHCLGWLGLCFRIVFVVGVIKADTVEFG
ncbi:hypothetical protein BSPWISOXPB_6137 [uncultured Gammaproteobacteria bacterium]|nr:hypothetical protein BSPWISOXPB_6137 [uncultured Gammaproteobacteria bacterium]